jgi:hypothetical protein
MLRMCAVLIVRENRYAASSSLYLDEHGEEDLRLVRGKALFLNEPKYQELLTLFVTNGVDHNTRLLDLTSIVEL